MAKTKNKKSNLSEVYAKKRKQQQIKKKLTPFEVHVNKDKKQVLGRKSKSDHGLPGISRTKAISKRKNTLLHEYNRRNKDNIFLDKRIGEKDSKLSSEDKALARFAAERIKAHKKKNIFNLNDEEILTHHGQALIDIEKFDDPKSDDDDYSDSENKTGKLDKKFVEEAHFGGGLLSKPESSLSRKDLIEQLIVESKKRKAERQKIREETIDLTEKLDSEWKDLLPIVASSNKALEKPQDLSKPDDFDIALKTLKFEARGMATDKLKSEEEIAKEEKDKLEKLEEERLARMKGFDESDSYKKHRSADDLDDFQIEQIEEEPLDDEKLNNDADSESINSTSIEQKNNSQDKSDDDCEDGSDDDENSSSEDADSSDADSVDSLEDLKQSDSEDESNLNPVQVHLKTDQKEDKKTLNADLNQQKKMNLEDEKTLNADSNQQKKMNLEIQSENNSIDIETEKAQKELPYTFDMPEDYNALCNLMKNYNPQYQSVIVERIIKCNHWKLSAANKEKLLRLFEYLLKYLNEIAENVIDKDELIEFFQLFNGFCPHFFDLAHANPYETKMLLHELIKDKHSKFEEQIKVYPGLDTLILFKLVSIIYPTSDFRHPIVTPVLVFMSQILLRCRVQNKQNISKGLFIVTLILEYTQLSKRWSPSVINYLRGLIFISLPKPISPLLIKVVPPFKTVGDYSSLLVLENNNKKLEINPGNIKMQAEDLIETTIDDDYRIRAFTTTINLLSEFLNICNQLDAAFLIFEPILKLLKNGNLKRYPKNIVEKVKLIINEIESLEQKQLEYLTFDKNKPKALRLYEPKLEIIHDGKRHHKRPMSKAKAEKEKLLHKLKKETKSAIREIRRDTAFISKVQIKQQIKSDDERKRKVKEIFGDAAMQQHELKKFKKKK